MVKKQSSDPRFPNVKKYGGHLVVLVSAIILMAIIVSSDPLCDQSTVDTETRLAIGAVRRAMDEFVSKHKRLPINGSELRPVLAKDAPHKPIEFKIDIGLIDESPFAWYRVAVDDSMVVFRIHRKRDQTFGPSEVVPLSHASPDVFK